MTDTPRRLINTHDQLVASGGGVAICKGGYGGRAWTVYRVDSNGVEIPTDTNARWYYHGKKSFPYFGADKAIRLEEAKAWVKATYGEEGPWKMNAMRNYVPERVQKAFPLRRKPKLPTTEKK